MKPLHSLEELSVVVDGLDHPECIIQGPDGTLWAGGEAGQVYRIDLKKKKATQIGSTNGFLLGLAINAKEEIFCCDVKNKAFIRMDSKSGKTETILDKVMGRPLVNPNYAVFGSNGILYVSDSGYWNQNDGFVFGLDSNYEVVMVQHKANHFPNGLAYSAKNNCLYVVETTLPAIGVLNLGIEDDYKTLFSMPKTVPDGIALDIEENLYISCYRPDSIYRYRNKTLELLIEDPQGTLLAAPTNICFAGTENKQLFIASLGRWHISSLNIQIPGQIPLWP